MKLKMLKQLHTHQLKIMEDGGFDIDIRQKAYNVRGNKGVKVNLKNGRHILIGSQNHNALANAIDNFIGS